MQKIELLSQKFFMGVKRLKRLGEQIYYELSLSCRYLGSKLRIKRIIDYFIITNFF